MLRERSRIFENKAAQALRNVRRFRKHQPGNGQQPGERAMQRRERARVAPDEVRDDRHGRKDALPLDQLEAGASPPAARYSATGRSPGCLNSDAVRIRRPRSRKWTRDCRCARFGTETSSSPPGRTRDAARRARAAAPRRSDVRARRGTARDRTMPSGNGSAVSEPGARAPTRSSRRRPIDVEPSRVLVDEDALAAPGVEHARVLRQRVQVAAHGSHLRDVGRVELPGGIERAVVVAALRVFTAAQRVGGSPSCGAILRYRCARGLTGPAAGTTAGPTAGSGPSPGPGGCCRDSGSLAGMVGAGSAPGRGEVERAGLRGRHGHVRRGMPDLAAACRRAACRGTGRSPGLRLRLLHRRHRHVDRLVAVVDRQRAVAGTVGTPALATAAGGRLVAMIVMRSKSRRPAHDRRTWRGDIAGGRAQQESSASLSGTFTSWSESSSRRACRR